MDSIFCTVSGFYLCKTDTPIFSWEKKEKRLDYKKKLSFKKKRSFFTLWNFFSSYHIYAMECFFKPFSLRFFPNKIFFSWSIDISNSTPIPLFVFVPVTLQLAYIPGKWRHLFHVMLMNKNACPTTSSRLKWSIATMAGEYSSYSLLISLLQNQESSPIWDIHTDMYSW